MRTNYPKRGLRHEVDIGGVFWFPGAGTPVDDTKNVDLTGRATTSFSVAQTAAGRYTVTLKEPCAFAGPPVAQIGVPAVIVTLQPIQILSFAVSGAGVVTFEIDVLSGGAALDPAANAASWCAFKLAVSYTTVG